MATPSYVPVDGASDEADRASDEADDGQPPVSRLPAPSRPRVAAHTGDALAVRDVRTDP
ncbi:hypothetical protein [Salinigranum marinum]|uniref:hypothetical protein n=1 Tax=Salinigranum marinum TaxID=1515595 RepID=UPI002989A3E3|nr:hypothetical protein [Salinigranum marinum]